MHPRQSYLLAVIGVAATAGLLPVPVWLRLTAAVAFVLGMIALSARYGKEIERGLGWLDVKLGRNSSRPRRVDLRKKLLKVSAVCSVLVSVASIVLAVSIGPPTGLPGDTTEPAPVDRSRASHAGGLQAVLGVANVTTQDVTYYPTRRAKVDQVVKAQFSIKNTNENGLPITGLRIAFDIPQEQGKSQQVGATVTAGGGIALATKVPVYLSLEQARLQYIPGSLKLRQNTSGPGEVASFATEQLSDTVLFRDDYPVGDVPAGEDGSFSITFLMRSIATAIAIRAQVRELPDGNWAAKSTSRPGARIQYRIEVENKGNEVFRETLVHANLSRDLAYVPDTTRAIIDGQLRAVPDGVVDFSSPSRATPGRGAQFGEVPVGGSLAVYFDAKVAPSAIVNSTLIAVLVVRVAGSNEFYNTAHLTLSESD